jgi:hypothetical protein
MPRRSAWTWTLAATALAVTCAAASPLEFVSPRDPLVAELRVLELYDLPSDSGRFHLPHFGTLPLRRAEVMGDGDPIGTGSLVRRLVASRLERELQRDAVWAFANARTHRSTPRLWTTGWLPNGRAELSVGLEGAYDMAEWETGLGPSRWRDGSGLHLRGGVQMDRWLAFLHLAVGQLEGASRYTDVLLSRTDVAAQTDQAYLAYTDGSAWSVAIGRQQFAWGPGESGSLLLSRTAAPLTALWMHGASPRSAPTRSRSTRRRSRAAASSSRRIGSSGSRRAACASG